MAARGPIREKRLQQVREWKASGLTRDEFAARVGLSSKTLGWWAWKLKSEGERVCGTRDAPEQPESGLQFVELEPMTTSTRSTAGLELELDGITVRVPDHFENTTLKRVLDVLEARR